MGKYRINCANIHSTNELINIKLIAMHMAQCRDKRFCWILQQIVANLKTLSFEKQKATKNVSTEKSCSRRVIDGYSTIHSIESPANTITFCKFYLNSLNHMVNEYKSEMLSQQTE